MYKLINVNDGRPIVVEKKDEGRAVFYRRHDLCDIYADEYNAVREIRDATAEEISHYVELKANYIEAMERAYGDGMSLD
jgi:hypothetical protein